MPFILAPGMSFCHADGSRIFLDLKNDRYFCLGAGADAAFEGFLCGDQPSADPSIRLEALVAAGILIDDPFGGVPRPVRARPIVAAPLDDDWPIRPSMTRTLAAAFALQRTKLDLRISGLARTCERLEARKASCRADLRRGSACELAAIAATFAASSRWVGALDQCLPLSVAIVRWCLAIGIAADLVLGVKLRPFQAHAWVAADGTLLSDRLETVRQFTPILIV